MGTEPGEIVPLLRQDFRRFRQADRGPALSLLERIDSPAALRKLPCTALRDVAREVRRYLIQTVSASGGHFASGLGTVELAIALHYVFETPEDRLVWDTGHQCYPHKILTGRRARMAGIRKKGGISGFLRRAESPYDAFGAGHAGTSIGAALGMALAARQMASPRKVVAVIGDGAMTAGMAFEAINHAGAAKADLLVVLNDNTMSISPNVGALSNYLKRLISNSARAARKDDASAPGHVSPEPEPARYGTVGQSSDSVAPGALFGELGFHYCGPIDGHDVEALVKTLGDLKDRAGPRLLHVITKKGKGYPPAECDPVVYHGVERFDPKLGLEKRSGSAHENPRRPTYTEVFGQWLCDMAERDGRLVGITPAMREGSGLAAFAERYPERYYDVGISEQHAVTLAAGLACEGVKPVVAIYSTFLQRALDQLIHDVAIQRLPVLFAIDRAGVVGADGPTHAGSFDLCYLRCVPDMTIMTPANENECRQMLYTGFLLDGPAAVRYPKGEGVGTPMDREMNVLPVGRAEVCRRGRGGIALLAFGVLLAPALDAGAILDASVVNMRFVKPLDEAVVEEMARSHGLLVTIEDNAVMGGAGSAVNECVMSLGLRARVLNLGLPDRFQAHGSRQELLAACGLDAEGILAGVENWLRQGALPGGAQGMEARG
jgi:1-deoxy-D-xylulose-5-phosphate synthase